MIPRLWVCTSHPVLQALTLPLQPLVILALAVAAWLVGNRSGGVWAMRLRRLWVTLALAVLIGLLLIALPGWVVVKIGGNGNPIFVAARYLWVGLAWSAVWVGLAWGKRDVAALPLAARVTAPATYASVYGFGALVVIVVIVARFFISDKQVPWSDPYFIGEWLFDMATTDLASDECLAFRSQDDQQAFGGWDPGERAMHQLRSNGLSAIPGIAAYLTECSEDPKRYARGPSCASDRLLFLVAKGGDHPVLQLYEKHPYYYTRDMRACIHRGGHVVWSGGPTSKPVTCNR